jgi:hypothetical protein
MTLCATVIAALVLIAIAYTSFPALVRASGSSHSSARTGSVAPHPAATSTSAQFGWNVSPVLNPGSFQQLFGVAATSPSDAWAVGQYTPSGCGPTGCSSQPLVEHFNGQTWALSTEPADGGIFYGAAALASNNVWIVGWGCGTAFTCVEHWNGSSWSIMPSPNPANSTTSEFKSISAVSANDIWAAGDYNSFGDQLVEHWNGSGWSIVTTPSLGFFELSLSSVSATSATNVWVAGTGTPESGPSIPLVEHWNGSTWTVTEFGPDPATGKIPSPGALVATPSGVWAAGNLYDPTQHTNVPLVDHWNGTSWTIVPSQAVGTIASGFSSIALTPCGDIWAAGSSQLSTGFASTHSLLEHWNGSSFTVVPDAAGVPHYGALYAVTEASRSSAFVVGETGTTNAWGSVMAEEYYNPFLPATASNVPSTTGGLGIACFGL